MRVADYRRRALGLMGGAVQLGMALAIGAVASRPGSFPGPPEPIPRGVALFLLLALPAAIGVLGTISGDGVLLAAAATLAAAGSVIAFSGITVIFAAPALLFAVAAGRRSDAERPRRPIWVSVVVLVAGGAAVSVMVLRLGIFALPLLVVGVLLLALADARPRRPRVRGAAAALVIVLLGIGAGWALLGVTETRCWEARRAPQGIEYRIVPEAATHVVTSTDIVAAGCDGGSLTARGAGIAAMLAIAALGLSVARASSP